MATKKFIIEVEEGVTKCTDCPFDEYRCFELGYIDAEMDCGKYNLATMRVKEYNVPDCYDMQCEARIPEFNIELEDKIELEDTK